MFKFHENKFKIVQWDLPGNKDNIKKKRFLGKATGHNDHCMLSKGGQRSKIGGN